MELAIFDIDRTEALLDLLYERSLSESEREVLLQSLIPPKKPRQSSSKNSEIVTDSFIKAYGEYRAIGLSKADAARLCGITTSQLTNIFIGEDLSEEQHKKFLIAEQRAVSVFKHKNLSVIHKAAQRGAWRAAVTLLEKVLPDEYCRRVEVKSSGSLRLSSEECKSMAQKAKEDLEKLRERRRKDRAPKF